MTQHQDDQDFASILAAFEAEQEEGSAGRDPRVGDKVTGRILSLGAESAFVELGGKSEGAIPIAELRDDDGELTVAVGDEIEALVAAVDPSAGVVTLKVRSGQSRVDITELVQAHAAGIPVEGSVQEVVKGGLSVTVGGVRAFCPVSQIDLRFVEDPQIFVGERLSFEIVRIEEGRGRTPNVVVSRRALLEREARAKAEELRRSLAEGKVIRGVVSSVTSYGAFVDLGGLEGLLHVSEMAHERVENPEELLAPGQEIEVKVLRIEPPKSGEKGSERISLSRKALLQDPWQAAAAALRPGTKRQGKVVRLQPFGAFVELLPGVDGLLHVSELGEEGRRVRHPGDVLEVGQAVEVSVRSVDLERRRISLGFGTAASEASRDEPKEWSDSSTQGFGPMADFFRNAKKK